MCLFDEEKVFLRLVFLLHRVFLIFLSTFCNALCSERSLSSGISRTFQAIANPFFQLLKTAPMRGYRDFCMPYTSAVHFCTLLIHQKKLMYAFNTIQHFICVAHTDKMWWNNLIHYLDLIRFSCHTIVGIEFDFCATYKQGLKPQPNDHNISTQHITTLLAQYF